MIWSSVYYILGNNYNLEMLAYNIRMNEVKCGDMIVELCIHSDH